MRQKLTIIENKDLINYDIPQLYFDENVIIIVYDEFTNNLFRYVHTPRIFLLPRHIFQEFSSSTFSITDTRIVMNDKIINNTNATIDGVPFFPEQVTQLKVQKEYLENYRKFVPERTHPSSLKGFHEAIEYLKSIKVPVDNFNNLELRIRRLIDFGNPKIATKLQEYYKKHINKFLDAASLSIQFNDLDDVCFSPLQSGYPALYYKLDNDNGVYSWSGYSTFIDTFTRVIFYTNAMDHMKLFTQYLKSYKPVMVVYGILNYHIAQDIHEKTNKNKTFYDILLKELE